MRYRCHSERPCQLYGQKSWMCLGPKGPKSAALNPLNEEECRKMIGALEEPRERPRGKMWSVTVDGFLL